MRFILLLLLLLPTTALAQIAPFPSPPQVPPTIANNSAMSNITGSAAVPVGNTITTILDSALGSTVGSIAERGASGWQLVTPGTSGLPLVSGGAGANPTYQLLTNAGMAQMAADTIKCNNTGSTAAPVDCTMAQTQTILALSPYVGAISQSATHNFYSGSGARINNINDRLFIGGATAYNGACCADTTSWLGLLTGTSGVNQSSAILAFYQASLLTDSTNGSAAGGMVIGAQSALLTGGAASIALFPIAVNNNLTGWTGGSWAIYAEAHRLGNIGGVTLSAEFEIRNIGNAVAWDPFTPGLNGGTSVLGLGCGAGQTSVGQSNCSNAMIIFANTMPFDSGIVILSGSISPYSSVYHAIDLPTTYQIVWMSATNTVVNAIWGGSAGNFNITATGGSIVFNGNTGIDCPTGVFATSTRVVGGIVTAC